MVPPILNQLPFIWSRWNMLYIFFSYFTDFWNFPRIRKIHLPSPHGPVSRNTLFEFWWTSNSYRIAMKLDVFDILIIHRVSLSYFSLFQKIHFPFQYHLNIFKPLLLPHFLCDCEPYFRNIMVDRMSIIKSEIDD